MAYSTQKLPKHHSHASSTQDSTYKSGSNASTYKDGSKAGSGGAKKDPDGPAPAARPKKYL